MDLFSSAHDLPAWNWALQGIGLITSYIGAELNSRMRVSGFYIWMVANLSLAIVHAASGLWLLLALDMLYFRINFMGIRRWNEAVAKSS
jgi:hypothetical protein